MKKIRQLHSEALGFAGKLAYVTLLASDIGVTSTIEILREGTIQDRGLKITREMLDEYVEHFNENVLGDVDEHGNPQLPVNLKHEVGSAAAGWIKKLYVDDADGTARLMATVSWTELGQENIRKGLYKYTSSEFNYKYPHHETGKLIPNVLSGLALINAPALKSQRPLMLSTSVDKLLNSIYMFEQLIANYAARAAVSKTDKTLLRTLLSALPADEQEANKAKVEEIEKKPEEVQETDEEKKARADQEAADKVAAEAKEKEVNETKLAAQQANEKLATATKEAEELKVKLATMESEKLAVQLGSEAEKLMVSKDNLTGFIGDGVKDKITRFTSMLSSEQRAAFYELQKSVKTVTLKEIGTSKDAGIAIKEGSQEQLSARANAIADEQCKANPKLARHEALAAAYREIHLAAKEETEKKS